MKNILLMLILKIIIKVKRKLKNRVNIENLNYIKIIKPAFKILELFLDLDHILFVKYIKT